MVRLGFFTQYDCDKDAFANELNAHCPRACGHCDHWLEKGANAAVASAQKVVHHAEEAAGRVKSHALRFVEAQVTIKNETARKWN